VLRTGLAAVVGALLGLAAGLALLVWGPALVRRLEGPPDLAREHWVDYVVLALTLSAGAVCGALAGLASALRRPASSEGRQGPPA